MVEKMKNEIQNTKNIFWFLTVGIALSLTAYVFFVSHTVYTVVERQNTERSIAALEHSIETLESNYVSLKSKVTVDLARSKGFKNISSSVQYIPQKPAGIQLSLHEI